MKEQTYIPRQSKDLTTWLQNFIKIIPHLEKDFNISSKDTKELRSRIKIVINDLKKKELGVYMDHISVSLFRDNTIEAIDSLLEDILSHPNYSEDHHGKMLKLKFQVKE